MPPGNTTSAAHALLPSSWGSVASCQCSEAEVPATMGSCWPERISQTESNVRESPLCRANSVTLNPLCRNSSSVLVRSSAVLVGLRFMTPVWPTQHFGSRCASADAYPETDKIPRVYAGCSVVVVTCVSPPSGSCAPVSCHDLRHDLSRLLARLFRKKSPVKCGLSRRHALFTLYATPPLKPTLFHLSPKPTIKIVKDRKNVTALLLFAKTLAQAC
jgi:hypothetical protein